MKYLFLIIIMVWVAKVIVICKRAYKSYMDFYDAKLIANTAGYWNQYACAKRILTARNLPVNQANIREVVRNAKQAVEPKLKRRRLLNYDLIIGNY